MLKNILIYICVKAALNLRQPLLWFIVLILSSFTDLKETKPEINPAIDSVINLDAPNIRLLENAILQSINNFRATHKLSKLSWSDTLFRSSQFHLENMKTKKFFDHTNPSDKNYPDLKKRVIKFSGQQYHCLSENLIQYFPFNFRGKIIEYNIKKIKTKYQYLDPKTLKPLQVLTYRQLSDEIVGKWEGSPPHRQNMLNVKYTYIGIAVSFPKYFKTPDVFPVIAVANFGGCK